MAMAAIMERNSLWMPGLITVEVYRSVKALNKDIENIYGSLNRQLSGSENVIVGRDSAEDKFIIKSYTDRNPGTYYLYERNSEKLTKPNRNG